MVGVAALTGVMDVTVWTGNVALAQTPIDDMKSNQEAKKSAKEEEKARIQAPTKSDATFPRASSSCPTAASTGPTSCCAT